MICPRCGSDRIRRAARRGLTEGILLRIAGRAPFRCFACGANIGITHWPRLLDFWGLPNLQVINREVYAGGTGFGWGRIQMACRQERRWDASAAPGTADR